jgi:hypothetical protein
VLEFSIVIVSVFTVLSIYLTSTPPLILKITLKIQVQKVAMAAKITENIRPNTINKTIPTILPVPKIKFKFGMLIPKPESMAPIFELPIMLLKLIPEAAKPAHAINAAIAINITDKIKIIRYAIRAILNTENSLILFTTLL